MRAKTFEVYKVKRGMHTEYRWRLKAGNGKIIANGGESYWNKKDCVKSIDSIIKTTHENSRLVYEP